MCQLQRYHTTQPAWESLLQGAGKEGLADGLIEEEQCNKQSGLWSNGPALYSGGGLRGDLGVQSSSPPVFCGTGEGV